MAVDARRRRRLRQWSRGLLALTLLTLAGAVVAFQAAIHWIAERELTRALDVRTRIERLRFSPFTGRLQITNLLLSGKQDDRPLLRIRSLTLEVLLLTLWQKEIILSRLSVEGPEVWVARTAEGFFWLPAAKAEAGAPLPLTLTLGDAEVRRGRVHLADRRGSPERLEVVDELDINLQHFSTRADRREAQTQLRLRGRWRGMTVSADGWVAPLAARPEFHLPLRVAQADLGKLAAVLPEGLAPAGLAGAAEVGLDIRGRQAEGGWQVEATVDIEARRVAARPRPDVPVEVGSVRLQGRGYWNPKVFGFSQLGLAMAGARIEVGGRLQASVDRLTANGQADLDHRGLLVPEMGVEVAALRLGPPGGPPAVQIGKIVAAGGTDQRAGTARLERVSLADVTLQAERQQDGSLDVSRWLPAGQGGGNGRPLTWEVLQLEVERAGLNLVDRGAGPQRTLAIRDVSLRLNGATSDSAQPIRFELRASSSLAPAIKVAGTWVRAPIRLQLNGSVQDADLPELRAWLPASVPVEFSEGKASLAMQADIGSGESGIAAAGSADATLRTVRAAAGSLGAFDARNLQVNLSQFRASGPDLASLRMEVQGELRGQTLSARLGQAGSSSVGEASGGDIQVKLGKLRLARATGGKLDLLVQGHAAIRNLLVKAAGSGVDSFTAEEVQAEVGALTAEFGPGKTGVELAGRVSLAQAEGTSVSLPVRKWKVTSVRADVGQLRTGPVMSPVEGPAIFAHIRDAEVDRPEVQILRSGESGSESGTGALAGALPRIRLDRLVVRNGAIAFQDQAVQPPWAAQLSQVEAAVEGLRTDSEAAAAVRVSAVEAGGARVQVMGRVTPVTWSGEVHAEVENLDLLRPGPYLPDVIHRVVRGGTASGTLDLSLRRTGGTLSVTGGGDLTFAPLELGDAERQLTLLLAETARVKMDRFSLDPLAVDVSAVRLERPWMALGRDEDGSLPAFRLLNALRPAGRGGGSVEAAAPAVTVGVLELHDGTAEIEDRAVRPRFRDRVQNLEVKIEGLGTQGDRKASVALTGELSDRSAVVLRGFILPLPNNFYVDLEGQIRDFNLNRLNTYATRVTSHRLEQGKLTSQVRYRIEQNRLEGENLLRIDQLAVGDQVEPEDRFEALVGLPLSLAISLLQDSSGEIILRVPVRGDLEHPEFDLGDAIASAIKNAVMQVVMAPFRLIGEIFTLGGRIGAIEIAPVRFAPGSWALDDAARAHLANLAAVLRDRPKMKVKLSGMVHVDSDEDGLRAQKVEEQLQRIARESDVKGREDALDRLFLRTFGASTEGMSQADKLARLKAAQTVTARDIEDLPDARTLSIYDHLANAERIDRNRMFLAEGKLYRTAEGGGEWARRVEFTILQP
jgi:hypothetical protein